MSDSSDLDENDFKTRLAAGRRALAGLNPELPASVRALLLALRPEVLALRTRDRRVSWKAIAAALAREGIVVAPGTLGAYMTGKARPAAAAKAAADDLRKGAAPDRSSVDVGRASEKEISDGVAAVTEETAGGRPVVARRVRLSHVND